MSDALLLRALERREELFACLAEEGTDCYRLFHGVAEGRPGLTLDRYGPVLLAQTWREPLTRAELAGFHRVVCRALDLSLSLVWHHRPTRDARVATATEGDLTEPPIGQELSLCYDVTPSHRGQDPLLFLDFRSGRREILRRATTGRVLNLFAYTGGVSLCALRGGASEVWHVDFSRQAMGWFRRNLALNDVPEARVQLIQEDVLPVIRQLAGLPVKGRAARSRAFQKFTPEAFDLVVVDPPRWAKSPFGAVDTVRDYPSLLKPALLATAPGGSLLVTNNAARVGRDDWLRMLERTGEKCGRPLAGITLIEPEADFPSIDGEPPLKMAWLEPQSS